MIKVFHLLRTEDESGVSGTGVVAEGIEFSDGTCVIHWLSHTSSTNVYDNIKSVDFVHGHYGKTEVKFIYEEPTGDTGTDPDPKDPPTKHKAKTRKRASKKPTGSQSD